jgi:hypothetical protein
MGQYIAMSRAADGVMRRIVTLLAKAKFILCGSSSSMGKSVLTMLEKRKWSHIKKLRIIQLVEADLNWIFTLIWSKWLEYKSVPDVVIHYLIDSCQFATGGLRCQSAALNIRLFNEIQRQAHEQAAIVSTDLKACFDRSLPAMVISVSHWVGIPETAADFLYCTMCSQSFQVGTGHKISEESYSIMDDPTKPGQGTGQG